MSQTNNDSGFLFINDKYHDYWLRNSVAKYIQVDGKMRVKFVDHVEYNFAVDDDCVEFDKEFVFVEINKDWSDEFDVYGFTVLSTEQFDGYKSGISKWYNGKHPCKKYYDDDYDEGLVYYFGTNESLEWDSLEDYFSDLKVRPITLEQFYNLDQVFVGGAHNYIARGTARLFIPYCFVQQDEQITGNKPISLIIQNSEGTKHLNDLTYLQTSEDGSKYFLQDKSGNKYQISYFDIIAGKVTVIPN